jgi:hypothetical protein
MFGRQCELAADKKRDERSSLFLFLHLGTAPRGKTYEEQGRLCKAYADRVWAMQSLQAYRASNQPASIEGPDIVPVQRVPESERGRVRKRIQHAHRIAD